VIETIALCNRSIDEFSFAFWGKPEFLRRLIRTMTAGVTAAQSTHIAKHL